jgi:hypothetical protein
MKPRPVSNEYISKAIELEQRLEALEISKAKCDCKEGECDCKDCPKCGSKMNKMGGCMKMDCDGKMEKAEPGFTAEKISNVNPSFHAESGGQTKSGYFTTNGKTIETEDAPKNKKAKETTNMQQLGSRMNPHEGSGVEREDTAGDSKPLKKANRKTAMREEGAPLICGLCGGTERSGCQLPQHGGMDLLACPTFQPLR